MPSPTTVLLFALATLLLTATPGPGVIYVTTRAISQGRKAGFASMLGIESGEVVWLAAAATGVAALLAASVSALTVLRLAGAAYLIYLAVRRWRSAEAIAAPTSAPVGRIYAQGVVTQLLNPKVAVFFVAFLPQFINPAEPLAGQVALLGVVYVAIAICVDVTYVLGAAAVSGALLKSRQARARASRVAAATYLALGLAAAAGGLKRS